MRTAAAIKPCDSFHEAYRRLVLEAPSLLPRCENATAFFLFQLWWREQGEESRHASNLKQANEPPQRRDS